MRRPEDPDARLRFGLFGALVAVALILHQLWWDRFEVPSLHAVVILAAFLVLLRPTSVPRVLAMLGLEAVAVARDMPGAGSHTLLLALCAAAIVLDAAVLAARRRAVPSAGELFARAAPFLRGAVVVLYLAAGIAKLNPDYFDLARGCGAVLAPRIVWFDPGLLAGADWFRGLASYASVATELALPVLLLARRTRPAGIVLGVGFHTVLALAGNVPFTGVMLALYVAFLPEGSLLRARQVIAPPRLLRGGEAAVLAGLVGAWLLGAAATASDPQAVRSAIGDGTRITVLLLAAVGAAAALGTRHRATAPLPPPKAPPRLRSPVLAAALALILANALSPYLGLKTESSFTMFSNLQTEGADWNHALLPEAVRLFGPQDHLVTVSASNAPALLRRTRGGTRMVRFELERYLRGHPGTWATYAPGRGAPRTTARAADVGFPGAALVDRVAKFRDVRARAQRGC